MILINKSEISTAYQDLTGRFPMKSSRGNEYILIRYHYDANFIFVYFDSTTKMYFKENQNKQPIFVDSRFVKMFI